MFFVKETGEKRNNVQRTFIHQMTKYNVRAMIGMKGTFDLLRLFMYSSGTFKWRDYC